MVNANTQVIAFRKVDIASVTCRSCRLPHSVNENGDCAFCARVANETPAPDKRMITRFQELVMAAVGAVLMAAAIVFAALWLAGMIGGK